MGRITGRKEDDVRDRYGSLALSEAHGIQVVQVIAILIGAEWEAIIRVLVELGKLGFSAWRRRIVAVMHHPLE